MSINEHEFDYYISIKKQWEDNQPRLSFYDLVKIFPEAKPIIKQNLLAQIKQYKKDLEQALQIKRRFSPAISKLLYQDRWFGEMIVKEFFIDPLVSNKEQKIKRNRFYLSFLNGSPNTSKNGKITEQDILLAKTAPIENFIQANSAGFAHCPFHEDKHPSLKVYKKQNRWYCYSCNSGTDTLDFIMKRDNCDFITAIKTILNK